LLGHAYISWLLTAHVSVAADPRNFLNNWKNYLLQLLSVHSVSDVKQVAINTAEPLVPGSNPFENEIAVAKLKV
jgi:hypothetical protein